MIQNTTLQQRTVCVRRSFSFHNRLIKHLSIFKMLNVLLMFSSDKNVGGLDVMHISDRLKDHYVCLIIFIPK